MIERHPEIRFKNEQADKPGQGSPLDADVFNLMNQRLEAAERHIFALEVGRIVGFALLSAGGVLVALFHLI